MNSIPSKKKKQWGLKVFFASLSITSLIGIFNSLVRKDNNQKDKEFYSKIDSILNAPLPTIVPLNNDVFDSNSAFREVNPIPQEPTPESQAPTIERITVGGSSSNSSPSTSTSSSR